MKDNGEKDPAIGDVGGGASEHWLLLAVAFSPIFGLWFLASSPLLPSLALFVGLWVLAVWDSCTFRLPNLIVLAVFVAGLLVTFMLFPSSLAQHFLGAGLGLLFPLVLNLIYHRLRGRDGIGMGDAKLLAAAGMWTGWQALPYILLIASFGGLAYAFIQLLRGKDVSVTSRLPFGPFLCLGTWVAWLFA